MHRRLVLLILVFSIPLLGAAYYISPFSKVSNIIVEGNKNLSAAEIIEKADLKVQHNLWQQFFDRKQIIQELKKNSPRIKGATLEVADWTELKLTVQELAVAAWLVDGKEYLPILETGNVIEEPEAEPEHDTVIFEGFSDEAKIRKTLKAYDSLAQEIQKGVSQIKYTPKKNNDELLNLYMNDGNRVIVNISNMDNQMKYYPQVVKEMKDKGIIDMEVGIFAYPYSVKKEITTENEEKSQ